MGKAEVESYLTWLAEKRKVAAATQNQAFNAILFLFRDVLEVDIGRLEGVTRAKKPKRLPVVLTRKEVSMVLNSMEGTPRLVASLTMIYTHVLSRAGRGVRSPLDHVTASPG